MVSWRAGDRRSAVRNRTCPITTDNNNHEVRHTHATQQTVLTHSGKFVRASKYRHVFGQAAKKELCYENLKITKNAWDSNIIHSNGKYLSVTWDASGGGAFAIIPLTEVGKAPDTVPLFRGHKGPVLDTAFNPFNSQQVASCSDDGKILLWEIPEHFTFHPDKDSVKDVTEPLKVLSGHTRKVGHIKFHPCAENVLASSSMDYTVKVWNLETGKPEISLQHKDLVTSFAFNYNGTRIATTSRDKKLRIWDLRTGEIVSEGPGHTGAKSSRVVWLGNTDRICTTGFSRLSDRQVGIWDVNDIAKGPIDGFLVIDSSSGVLIPIYDDSNQILYLAGKGDGNIRYYEYDKDELYELSQYASTDPQRGFAAAPKIAVNTRECEVLKSFKTVNDTTIEPISFIVPRKSELFQDDIYPDAPSDKPAVSASEWFGGKDVNGPLLVNMEAIFEGTAPETKESAPAVNISTLKKEATPAPAPAPKEASPAPAKTPKEPTPVATPVATKEVSKGKADDVLQSSDKVNDMLNKVVDESDDEDAARIQESNDKDDEWEEVKKPVEESKPEPKSAAKAPEPVAKVESKVEPKAEPKAERKVESKEEPKVEPKAEPKIETPKVEKEVAPNVETKTAASETAKAATPAPETKSAAAGAGQPTLRSTVDKLASLVEALESQVTKLVEANIEKNDKIHLLEEKINELLQK